MNMENLAKRRADWKATMRIGGPMMIDDVNSKDMSGATMHLPGQGPCRRRFRAPDRLARSSERILRTEISW